MSQVGAFLNGFPRLILHHRGAGRGALRPRLPAECSLFGRLAARGRAPEWVMLLTSLFRQDTGRIRLNSVWINDNTLTEESWGSENTNKHAVMHLPRDVKPKQSHLHATHTHACKRTHTYTRTPSQRPGVTGPNQVHLAGYMYMLFK